jgi:sn1-specific diacylglycerol lipase
MGQAQPTEHRPCRERRVRWFFSGQVRYTAGCEPDLTSLHPIPSNVTVQKFSITRNVASTAAGMTGTVVDHVLFGGTPAAGPALSSAFSSAISLAENLALLPILIGESITSTSLVAAHSSVNVLSSIFPGSDEASFSLASFVTLVRREWRAEDAALPAERYGITEVAAALVAWGALQGVTAEWAERRWLGALEEIRVFDEPGHEENSSKRERRESRVRVNSNAVVPSSGGRIITADIGDAPASDGEAPVPGGIPIRAPSHMAGPHVHFDGLPSPSAPVSSAPGAPQPIVPYIQTLHERLSNDELKSTLRRLSKLVLAGYGGASLLFFGVSPTPSSSTSPSAFPEASAQQRQEEVSLATALEASEAEAQGASPADVQAQRNEKKEGGYSWWNLLMGRHDHDILKAYADAPIERAQKDIKDANAAMEQARGRERDRTTSVFAGQEHLLPRFWVLKDHGRRQVVLVIRGKSECIVCVDVLLIDGVFSVRHDVAERARCRLNLRARRLCAGRLRSRKAETPPH